MMPSDCHIGCTQPLPDSDSEPISFELSERSTATDHAHGTAHGSDSSVKNVLEGAEDSQIADSLLVTKTVKPTSQHEQCGAGSVCDCPGCHKSSAVSSDDVEVCLSDVQGSHITEPDLLQGAAEFEVFCTCSGGRCGRSRHICCATAVDLHEEKSLETAAVMNGAGTDSSLCKIFLSNRVLQEKHHVHQCLSSACGSAALRTDVNKNFSTENVQAMHASGTKAVMFNTACSLPEQTVQMGSHRKINSNANADIEIVSSDIGINRGRSSTGVTANDQENLTVQSSGVTTESPVVQQEEVSFGHGEHTASGTSAAEQHAHEQSLPASSEGHSSGGTVTAPLNEPASFFSGISLEPALSVESIGSVPLINALSLHHSQPELSDLYSTERETESLSTVNAIQGGQEMNSSLVVPSSYCSTSPALLDISGIPDEVLLHVFFFLNPAQLCRHVTGVCKRWRRLAYDHSLWSRLDLSRFKVTGFQLCQLVLQTAGAIRYLDMSGMERLTLGEMGVVAENCPQLTHLDMGFVDDLNCPMMNAILTSCPSLEFINVEGCRNANNEMMRVLAVSAGPCLKRLNFSHCTLVDESLWLMMRHLRGLTHLNIDGISWISELVVRHLASTYSSTLESLELDGNELTDGAIEAVSGCVRLRVLSISFCEQLTDLSVKFLKRLENLEKLSLRKGNGFMSSALTELLSCPALANLTYLDMTECQQMNDDCAQAIAHTCGQNLKWLNLSWCWDITDKGMEDLTLSCRKMVTMLLAGLHRLEGSWLATAVETMPALTYISLEQCNMVEDMVIEEAVREKPDLVICNYYGEIFTHAAVTE